MFAYKNVHNTVSERNKIRIICWQMLKYLLKCEPLLEKILNQKLRFVRGHVSSYDSILRINMWFKVVYGALSSKRMKQDLFVNNNCFPV